MNKAEFIACVSSELSLPKKQVKEVFDKCLEVIQESVAEGENVVFMGFGTFKPSHRKARKGRNPQTGEEMLLEAQTLPIFTVGKHFKEAVNS